MSLLAVTTLHLHMYKVCGAYRNSSEQFEVKVCTAACVPCHMCQCCQTPAKSVMLPCSLVFYVSVVTPISHLDCNELYLMKYIEIHLLIIKYI